ncbi:MAG: hypothetical protein ACYCTW_01060 [Sulfuricella sp.]
MTANLIHVYSEWIWIIGSIAVLFAFALAIVLRHRSSVRSGSSGHRDDSEEGGYEEVRADGYIDAFAGEVEEAGGGLPPVMKLVLPVVLLSWLIYLILNWTP